MKADWTTNTRLGIVPSASRHIKDYIMAKTRMFYQCDLSQGTGRDKAFIDERGAVVGNTVELGGSGTNDFWRVDNVSFIGLTEDTIKTLQERHHKGWGSLIDI